MSVSEHNRPTGRKTTEAVIFIAHIEDKLCGVVAERLHIIQIKLKGLIIN